MAARVHPLTVPTIKSLLIEASSLKRSGQNLLWLGLMLGLTTSCGMTGTGPFGDSRGKAYADCSSMLSPDDLTIYTWWQTDLRERNCDFEGGEACAVHSLEETYAECTGGTVSLVNQNSKEETLIALERNNLEQNNKGDVDAEAAVHGAIINGKADVCRLAGDDLTKPGLASLATADQSVVSLLNERTPAPLRNLVTCKGYQFGAIVGLHRLNQLFYKRSITEQPELATALTERGIELERSPELTLEALETIFQILHDQGYERPLLLLDDPTMWSRFLIENLMVAVAEQDTSQSADLEDSYTAFWSELSKDVHADGNRVNMVPFDKTLDRVEALARYISYIPANSEGKSILQNLIAHDRAVFTVTGDWEQPDMPSNVAMRAFPGTDGAYVYTADVAVVMPTSRLTAQHPMMSWLKVVTSSQAQAPFHKLKHSLDFLTTVNGHTRSKRDEELFTVADVALRGYQGLPAYVPHLSFDDLGGKIRKHLKCLVDSSQPDGTFSPPCETTKSALSRYVLQQYCQVISGTTDGCAADERPFQQIR